MVDLNGGIRSLLHSLPVLCLCLTATGAELVPVPVDADARPASPEQGRVALSSRFRFPPWDAPSQSTTVVCQVLVSRKGQVSARKCAQHGGDDRFRAFVRNEVHERLTRSRFRPAIVDGQPEAVSMPLRAEVACDAQASCTIAVYPNTGQHRTEYGDDYFAPQEIIEQVGTWYDRLVSSAPCGNGRDARCREVDAFAFAAAVRVGEDGLVTGVGTVGGIDPGDFPVEAALARLVEARFIPARRADEVVSMLIPTPTLHSRNNPHFARSYCREVEAIGTRLEKNCYTMQEYAALRLADDPNSFGENLQFWLP
jgi:hypothetical protein